MARRKTEVFSLSFLDVIACGFGAIVLFYTILSRAGRSAAAGAQRRYPGGSRPARGGGARGLQGSRGAAQLARRDGGADASLRRGGAHRPGDGAAEGAARALGQGNVVTTRGDRATQAGPEVPRGGTPPARGRHDGRRAGRATASGPSRAQATASTSSASASRATGFWCSSTSPRACSTRRWST